MNNTLSAHTNVMGNNQRAHTATRRKSNHSHTTIPTPKHQKKRATPIMSRSHPTATEHSEEQPRAIFSFFKTKPTKPPSHYKVTEPDSLLGNSRPDPRAQRPKAQAQPLATLTLRCLARNLASKWRLAP